MSGQLVYLCVFTPQFVEGFTKKKTSPPLLERNNLSIFRCVKPFLEAHNRELVGLLATNALQFHPPPGLRGLTVYTETNTEVCCVEQK